MPTAVEIKFSALDSTRFDALKIDASGLSSAERERLGADVNESVFFSAKVSDARLLEQMRDYISRAARGESGYHRDDFIKRMKRALGLKPNQGGTRIDDITSFARLELIYEHNLRKINGRNQYLNAAKDADIAPARELYRSQERKVPRNWIRRWREAGGKFYGKNGEQRMIAPFFDAIWTKISRFGTPFPPFDFNSGMWVRPVSAREASELGVLTKKDIAVAAQTAPQQAEKAREAQDESNLGTTAELPKKPQAQSVEPQTKSGDGGRVLKASGEQVGGAGAERDAGVKSKLPASDAEVRERFNSELDAFVAGTHKGELHLGVPGETLRACGLNATEMKIEPKVLKAHLKKHDIPAESLRDLPDALNNPLMVYEWGTKARSMIVVTDLTLKDGRKITAAVKLERNGALAKVNELASIHGKAAERLLEEATEKEQDFGRNKLKYADKEKAVEWLGIAPPKGASAKTSQRLRLKKIIENFENPSIEKSVTRGARSLDPEAYLPKVIARTNAEANAALKEQQGKAFVNAETGIEARLSNTARGKLVSNAAAEKSEANGFTREQHLTAAANVGDLFERAYLFEDRADKYDDPNIYSIKRFASLLVLDGEPVEADILTKESEGAKGHRIYTVELQQIKKPSKRPQLRGIGGRDEPVSIHTNDGRDKIAELAEKINGKISQLSVGAFVALLYKSRFGDKAAANSDGSSMIYVGARGVSAGAAFDSARGSRFSVGGIEPTNVCAVEETSAARAVNVYRAFEFSESLTREQAKLCAMIVERPQRVDYSRAGARFVFSRACGEKTHYAFGEPQDGETLLITYGGEKSRA